MCGILHPQKLGLLAESSHLLQVGALDKTLLKASVLDHVHRLETLRCFDLLEVCFSLPFYDLVQTVIFCHFKWSWALRKRPSAGLAAPADSLNGRL